MTKRESDTHWDDCDGTNCLLCDLDRHGERSIGFGCSGCRATCPVHGEEKTNAVDIDDLDIIDVEEAPADG